jgi:hypothetical protein
LKIKGKTNKDLDFTPTPEGEVISDAENRDTVVPRGYMETTAGVTFLFIITDKARVRRGGR